MASAKWRPFCLGLNVLRGKFLVSGSGTLPQHIETDIKNLYTSRYLVIGRHFLNCTWNKYQLIPCSIEFDFIDKDYKIVHIIYYYKTIRQYQFMYKFENNFLWIKM